MQQERIRIGQLEIIFFASAESTDGHADVFEVIVPAGAKVPGAHYHVEVDEVVSCLEGVLTYTLGGVAHELHPGQSLMAPKGVEHHFANRSSERARFLSVLTPAKIGANYFREMAALLGKGGPPDMAQVGAIMRKHGLEPTRPDVR